MPEHLLNGSIASAYGTGGVATSILQAFLRASPGIAPRACGRRCLAGNHLRTWCPPNKPARLDSGSGESWFDPRRGNATRDGMFGPIALPPRPFQAVIRGLRRA